MFRHAIATSLLCVIASSSALAQTKAPGGTVEGAKPVTTGKTELGKDTFETTGKKDPNDKDATELAVQAGGLLAGGNSRLLALTGGGNFRYRREENQVRVQLAGNYGRAAKPPAAWETTVENIQGVGRYDRFFGDVTLFFATQIRRDRFQGLDLRLQLDPGVGYYFVNMSDELLWGELGYDLRYDVRRDDSLTQRDTSGKPILDPQGREVQVDKTAVVHSSRLFFGYQKTLGTQVKFNAGIEYLQSIPDTELYRVNGETALTAKIGKQLAVAMSLMAKYENQPLPGKQQLDTVSSVSLVYTLLE
jgi:putative salt-induced outer membrane protein